MATISDNRTAGGKITRSRRTPKASAIPYARSPPSNVVAREAEEEGSGNNWISNVIYPIKFIASGAAKVFSFFGNDYDDESSDDDNDDDSVDDDEMYDGENDGSHQVLSPASKSDSKRKIDQLVMEDTFSREEGERLIRLVKSRMVDTNVNFGEGTPVKNKAIMEAKKWLEERRSGSKKNLEVELDLTSSHFTRKDKGSPADVAKSFMQNRTWSLPSGKQTEFGSPSALGMLHFKEETPISTWRSFSERKRNSFATGSWNLSDEIRKVRTKATEDLLATTPLTKPTLSMFINSQDVSKSKGDVEEPGPTDSAHDRPDHVLNDATAISSIRDNQDGDDVQLVELLERTKSADVSVSNYVKDIEIAELTTTTPQNGFVASSQVQQNAADEPKSQPNHVIGSSLGAQDNHVENSNLLTDQNEIKTGTDSVINSSRNSSSMQEEDSSQSISQTTMDEDDDPTFIPGSARKETRLRGYTYTRRSRGRGK